MNTTCLIGPCPGGGRIAETCGELPCADGEAPVALLAEVPFPPGPVETNRTISTRHPARKARNPRRPPGPRPMPPEPPPAPPPAPPAAPRSSPERRALAGR